MNSLLAIIENLGILIMLWYGTFIKTRLFSYAQFAIGLMILGLLFKILHYPGGDELIAIASLALLTTYFIHFLRKTSKTRLDYLKMLTVTAIALWPPIVMLHLIPAEIVYIVRIIISGLFAVTFIGFLYNSYKEGRLFGGTEQK